MSRISNLEELLDSKIKEYDRRLKRLECEHVKEPVKKWDGWNNEYYYVEECYKCNKQFRILSEQEYLELKLKQEKEKCASERKELEERLAVVKKENE